MKRDFKELSADSKIIFFLGLADTVVSVFSNEDDRTLSKYVLDCCWKWLKSQSYTADYLCDLLDNEDDGMTLRQEASNNKKDQTAWDCIIDAVAYTCRKAYEYEKSKYYPEPIELVDDELINHFIECYDNCVSDSKAYMESVFSLLKTNTSCDYDELRKDIFNRR